MHPGSGRRPQAADPQCDATAGGGRCSSSRPSPLEIHRRKGTMDEKKRNNGARRDANGAVVDPGLGVRYTPIPAAAMRNARPESNRIESWRNDVPLRAAPRLTDVTHGDAGVGLDSGAEIVSAAPIDRPNQSELRYSSKPNCPAVRRGRRALRTQPTPRTSASSSSWRR